MTREEIAEAAISAFVNNSAPSRDLILSGEYLIHVDNCHLCDFDPDYLFATELGWSILHSHH